MDPASIAFIVSVIVEMITQGVNLGAQHKGTNIRSKITKLSNIMTSKLRQNNEDMNKLIDAYQNKNSSLFMQIANQSSIGPAIEALRREIKNVRDEYAEKRQEISKEGEKLEHLSNNLANASMNSGTIGGNKAAKETIENIDQAINGGLMTRSEKKTESKEDKTTSKIGGSRLRLKTSKIIGRIFK